jgi:biopolymer transport protein ExbB/TolQ
MIIRVQITAVIIIIVVSGIRPIIIIIIIIIILEATTIHDTIQSLTQMSWLPRRIVVRVNNGEKVTRIGHGKSQDCRQMGIKLRRRRRRRAKEERPLKGKFRRLLKSNQCKNGQSYSQ